MTITAKYPGKCTICGGKINAGEKINWGKDKGASHVKCPEKVEPVGPKKMIAKYEGKCKTCYCKIEVGDAIYYEKGRGAKHVDCVAAMEREQQREIERKKHAPYEATRGSGYALSEPFVVGEVIEAPRHTQQEGIKYLVVVEAEEQYVSEDGYSFGVGAESGYVYVARCRAASDEEAAPLIEKNGKKKKENLQEKRPRRDIMTEKIKAAIEKAREEGQVYLRDITLDAHGIIFDPDVAEFAVNFGIASRIDSDPLIAANQLRLYFKDEKYFSLEEGEVSSGGVLEWVGYRTYFDTFLVIVKKDKHKYNIYYHICRETEEEKGV